MSDPAAPPRVQIERAMAWPIEEVFAAWTDPRSMAEWLSPTGRAEVEADVRVGGSLRVVMLGDDVRIEHTGEFLAVDPPHLLSFTWRSPSTGESPSVVTIRLHREGDRTRLVLVHEQLPPDAVAPHASGWGSILDRLGRVLDATRTRRNGPS